MLKASATTRSGEYPSAYSRVSEGRSKLNEGRALILYSCWHARCTPSLCQGRSGGRIARLSCAREARGAGPAIFARTIAVRAAPKRGKDGTTQAGRTQGAAHAARDSAAGGGPIRAPPSGPFSGSADAPGADSRERGS